jgi:hypothetical protein
VLAVETPNPGYFFPPAPLRAPLVLITGTPSVFGVVAPDELPEVASVDPRRELSVLSDKCDDNELDENKDESLLRPLCLLIQLHKSNPDKKRPTLKKTSAF